MWSTLRTGRGILRTLTLSILFSTIILAETSSCAVLKKRGKTTPSEQPILTVKTNEDAQPQPSPSAALSESLPSREPGIEVFFGPGMATGFAYQGVLKNLTDWKIKIAKIHCQEIGALVSVAYAEKANVNRMDWTLTRFPENSFTNKTSGLLFKNLESVETRLEKRLAETFQSTKAEDFAIPVVIEGVSEEGLSLWEKIRVSLTNEPLLAPYKNQKKIAESIGLETFSKEAKNKILSVIVKPSAETKVLQLIPGQLLVVQLGIPNFADDDFKRRSQAAYYGKNQLEKLKKDVLSFAQTEDLR